MSPETEEKSIESETFPARIYKENVLADCFEDAKRYFLQAYLDVDYAHAVMLAEQGIITEDELKELLRALRSLDLDSIKRAEYDGTFEDLFYYLQREITKHCDADTSGKLHTARS
ncbi:MAG: argininosuccinate lyase, partial [Acidobacteriota bacterium]|nr:argininosuccinate lyase [Acidobacteriota bacterium]